MNNYLATQQMHMKGPRAVTITRRATRKHLTALQKAKAIRQSKLHRPATFNTLRRDEKQDIIDRLSDELAKAHRQLTTRSAI